jgi:hypothetical protein
MGFLLDAYVLDGILERDPPLGCVRVREDAPRLVAGSGGGWMLSSHVGRCTWQGPLLGRRRQRQQTG